MKKLLSIILVLAMLLGMASVSAFADEVEISGSHFVATGETITLTTNAASGTTLTWNSSATSNATVNGGKVTGVAAGDTNISCTGNNITSKSFKVTVLDYTKLTFDRQSGETLSQVVSVNDTRALNPIAKYNSAPFDNAKLNDATFTVESSDEDIATATVNQSTGEVTVKGLKKGDTTIEVAINFAGWTDYVRYAVEVAGFELADNVENGDDFDSYNSGSALCDAIADAINEGYDDADVDDSDITSIKFECRNKTSATTYGSLKAGKTTSSVASTDNVKSNGVTFSATKGCLGDMVYDVTVTANSYTYKGTWTITVDPVEEIDEEYNASFAKEDYYIDFPSDVDYLQKVDDEDHFAGVYKKSDSAMKEEDEFLINPTSLTTKNGVATLYVVGLDDDGYAYSGTIALTGADYDFEYPGEEDEKTTLAKKDFINLFDDIAENKGDDDSPYEVSLDTVTFELSSKYYSIYQDGTKLKTGNKIDVDDLGEIEVEPLDAKRTIVNFTMKGTKTNTKTDKDTTLTYKGALLVNAVAGDVAYTVAANGSVYLDADDFQDFFEDAIDSTSAVLSYIIIDNSDLRTTEGVFYATKNADIEDEKLWADEDDTTTKSPYEIADVRFVANKSLASGTKIYVPFTAYGKKGSTSKTAEGYIAFEVKNNSFTDVKTTDYFYDAVLWATGKGITKGTNVAGTLFSPAQGCTRAQVVTFLYRAAGSPSITSSMRAEVAKFTDVNTTKHKDFIDAIAWAKYYGITSGTSATTFGPDKTCTRAQIVTFIANYVNKVEGKSVTPIYSNQFTDVKPTTTHKSYAAAIQWAVEKGITKGTNAAGTLFSPDATCTRGQVVTFLYNYFK